MELKFKDIKRVITAFSKRFPKTELNEEENRLVELPYGEAELKESIMKYITDVTNSVEEDEAIVTRNKIEI